MLNVYRITLMFTGYCNEHCCLKTQGSNPLLVNSYCGLCLLCQTLMNKCNAGVKRIDMILLGVTGSPPTEIDRRLNTELC